MEPVVEEELIDCQETETPVGYEANKPPSAKVPPRTPSKMMHHIESEQRNNGVNEAPVKGVTSSRPASEVHNKQDNYIDVAAFR
jgi:hypothetical protein